MSAQSQTSDHAASHMERTPESPLWVVVGQYQSLPLLDAEKKQAVTVHTGGCPKAVSAACTELWTLFSAEWSSYPCQPLL